MIAYLKGKIIAKKTDYVILERSGIGYQIFINNNLELKLKLNQETELFIYQQIKEDTNDLYGFKTLEDWELFSLLLSVSGVGPKSALGIIALAPAADIKEAIRQGDAILLTKVSGIGQKTAQRLVLELKNKINKISRANLKSGQKILTGSDEMDALMSLGYSLNDARAALNQVDPNLSDSGERIKAALKKMKT